MSIISRIYTKNVFKNFNKIIYHKNNLLIRPLKIEDIKENYIKSLQDKTIEEDLRTEVTLRRELDSVLRDNELLTHELKMNIDGIVDSDTKRTKLENLLELTNYLINAVHDACISGD